MAQFTKEPDTITLTTPGGPAEYQLHLAMMNHGMPVSGRGTPTLGQAPTIPLSGIGVDETGKGHSSKPTLSPMGANMAGNPAMRDQPRPRQPLLTELEQLGAAAHARITQQAAQTAGLSLNNQSTVHDTSIVLFYQRGDKVHVKIQAPADRFQCIDRPMRPEDTIRYPKAWHNFINGAKLVDGTPLDKMFVQQPMMVRSLQAEKILTVEQLANLSDPGIEQIAYLGGSELIQRANAFLAQHPVRSRDDKIAELEAEVEQLKRPAPAEEEKPAPRRRR